MLRSSLARRPLKLLSRHLSTKTDPLAARFAELVDLADGELGGRVLFATDEWFATADNLLKPHAAVFDPDAFCVQGKVMDGWESRRRRTAGFDWCVVRLGLAGHVQGIEIDTAWFTGNQTPAARVFAAHIDDGGGAGDDGWIGPKRATLGVQGTAATPAEVAAAEAAVGAAAEWSELVPLSPLRPGTDPPDGSSVHRFAVPPELAGRRVTHLRLNQHPDGGIARMRAWGVVARDYDRELAAAAVGAVDLLSVLNGARALGCSNRHYGEPRNLIKPGRGANMGAGWETARNPRRPAEIVTDAATGLVHMPGASDWCVLRLAAVAGKVERLVIDTCHFRGNFPESVLVEALHAPAASTDEVVASAETSNIDDGSAAAGGWRVLLPRTRLGPDAEHEFGPGELEGASGDDRISHLRVSIFPDGGIMRVRLHAEAVAPLEDAGGSGGG